MLGREESHKIVFPKDCPVGTSLHRTEFLRQVQSSHYALTGKCVTLCEIAEHSLRHREYKTKPRNCGY